MENPRSGNGAGPVPPTGYLPIQALGNFPQAFTHLAPTSAAVNLDRALDRITS